MPETSGFGFVNSYYLCKSEAIAQGSKLYLGLVKKFVVVVGGWVGDGGVGGGGYGPISEFVGGIHNNLR